MTPNSVVHGTFVIERTYGAPPARVFAAFADPAIKRRWFAEGKGSELLEFTMDFRVGGRELGRFRFQGRMEMRNDTVYQDIVADWRIVFAYTMSVEDKRISASLATIELAPTAGGTRLAFTEQSAFFEGADGPKIREEGWRTLLQRLEDDLRSGK
jgi:uncharacterized protein YndB with AHSA1/START domain